MPTGSQIADSGKGCMMLWLKACPRCGGDLMRASLEDELTASCLQCGYASSLGELRGRTAKPSMRVPQEGQAIKRLERPQVPRTAAGVGTRR